MTFDADDWLFVKDVACDVKCVDAGECHRDLWGPGCCLEMHCFADI